MTEKIGLIGLGIMGMPMAHNLIKAGYHLTVFNRTAARCDEIVASGAHSVASPAELAAACDVIITIVSDTTDVESVILGTGASGTGVIEGVHTGSVVIDMSTISPRVTRAIAERLAAKGAEMLDAPVSGGQQGAIDGALSIMVGGDATVFQRCLPVLAAIGKNVIHVGPTGSGQMVKLTNQILVAGTLNAVVEALVFAEKSGVNLDRTIDALQGGAAGSWQLTNMAPKIIARDFRPGFMIDLMQKDLSLVMAAAAEMKVPLPGTSLVHHTYFGLQTAGEGSSGTQTIVKALERAAGVEVGGARSGGCG